MIPTDCGGRVLVTGASGFVGQALCRTLLQTGFDVTATSRRLDVLPGLDLNTVRVGDMDGEAVWGEALIGCSSVIHLAARVHVMREKEGDSLSAYRAINTHGTMKLALQAAKAGVKRFVYLSTIKVNGEETAICRPFKPDDMARPQDPYAVSKHEAEAGLRELAGQTGMEVVIIRPPLVYGPGVKANFHSMMGWLHRGMPLPFGAIHNKRSLVALDNLVDLLVTCIQHPSATNQTFLVSDYEDLSTTELLRRMGVALGRPARLIPVPQEWLAWGAGLLGRKDLARRLVGSLQVDIGKTHDLLGWSPKVTVEEALRKTAQHFISHGGR